MQMLERTPPQTEKQVRSKSKMKCAACGRQGHLAWHCYSITPAEQAEYKEWQSIRRRDDSSIGSNSSSRSEASHATVQSGSSGSASGNERRSGRRATPPRTGRKSVFEMSNFAFSVEGRPASFN